MPAIVFVRSSVAALVGAAAALIGTAIAAAEETYPARSVRLIVPAPPGGAADLTARIFAQELTPRLGQPVVVDNRAGASGAIGSDAAARAPADGYTLVFALISSHAVVPALSTKPPYDPLRDFAPVIRVADCPQTLVAYNDAPFSSVAELIAHAKRHPGEINYGSAGTGSIQHLAGELFGQAAGIHIVHVPYRGDSLAMHDVMAGVVHIYFTPAAKPAVEARKVKLLGVGSLERWPAAPDWPTIAESGLPDFRMEGWNGIMAPAATPRAIVRRLNALGNEVLAHPAVRKRLGDFGCQAAGGSAEAFAATVRNDLARFRQLTIKLD